VSELNIEFQPLGRRGKFQGGQSFLDYARRLGIGISSVCGGKGTCGKCRVQLVSGTTSEPTSRETQIFSSSQIQAGWRLACQAIPASDCTVHVPVDSMTTLQRTQLEGVDIPVPVKSPVRVLSVKMPPPSLTDTTGDADRLQQALHEHRRAKCNSIDITVMRTLSRQLREWSWQCHAVVRSSEVIAVRPSSGLTIGLAVDFGTTKLAAYLVDLTTGKTLASHGMMNPQISFGEDIIARCNIAVTSPEGALQMQKMATDAISELGAILSAEVGVASRDIVEAVVVGNTAMHHLYLGLPVKQLVLAPFIAAVKSPLDIKARDLGIQIAPGAYVHILPNIAGFVGADHVAMLLATEVGKMKKTTIALDIGTNTEVSLIYEDKIQSISCASGPAFEGGHIKDGMRAGAGAIERVRITKEDVQYQTIDNAPPVGICGSGIIDTVAQLFLAGVIDNSGRMQYGHPRVRVSNGQREFVLAGEEERHGLPAVVFTQHDVRELQLGKAAIRAGIRTLLQSNKMNEEDISDIIIAGAFGSYLDVSSAVDIGMLPALALEHFHQVGNAAGMGAKRALISTGQRKEAARIAEEAHYLELAGSPIFNKNFIQAVQLGRYRLRNGKREEVD
jgi:uncharacterized 2Fe-2S/4Fe-4S cluster protein (DUF4445 family)